MLPRNLQNIVLRNATRSHLLLTRQHLYSSPFRIAGAVGQRASGFHSSSRRQNEVPKSPFQTFVDVLRDELKKNRELQDNVKQLQGDVDKLQDSEAMKRARAAYERARVGTIFFSAFENSLTFCFLVNVKYQRESEATGSCGGIEKDGS